MAAPFINRVTLRNYKSIAWCRLDLPRLAFLVGRNGAGKSNFLDSISFVSEALLGSLGIAIEEDRDGIDFILRRTGADLGPMAIRIDFSLFDGSVGHFGFEIGRKSDGGFELLHEECKVNNGGEVHYYVRHGDGVRASRPQFPPVLPDRLCLVAAAGFAEFRPVFDLLVRMAVYNPNPETMSRALHGTGGVLQRVAKNITHALKNLRPQYRSQINEFLSESLGASISVEIEKMGDQEIIQFLQNFDDKARSLSFTPESMSDGVIRALCILAVIFQRSQSDIPLHWLIGLEEPETALHPATASSLLALLRLASQNNQILITSHSPDLLDNDDIPTESIFVVDQALGVTRITGIDPASRNAMQRKSFTAGELLRQNQLAPDPVELDQVSNACQIGIFDFPET